MIEVVAFAGTLTHAGKDGHAAVTLGDIVDQFLDQHGLADAGTAEQTDLAALGIGREQIDNLDAGDENGAFGRLIDEQRSLGMDRRAAFGAHGAALVDGFAHDIHDAAQRLRPDGNRDLATRIDDFLSAGQAFGRVHRDGAHGVLTKVLRDFQNQRVRAVLRFQGGEDVGQFAFELDIDDGADDLGNDAIGGLVEYGGGGHGFFLA